MAFSYTHEITSLKVKDEVNSDGVTLQNAVCQTYWKRTGTDADGNSGTFAGATPFSAASVGEDDFTDFADLTEAQVIGWITNVIDNDATYKAHIDEQIQKQIDEAAGVQTEHAGDTLPWGASEPADDGVEAPADPDAA